MGEAKIRDIPWILEEGDLEPKNMNYDQVEVDEMFLRKWIRKGAEYFVLWMRLMFLIFP